jgi:hypothetical protein
LPDDDVEIGFSHCGHSWGHHAIPHGAGIIGASCWERMDAIVSPRRGHFKRRFSRSDAADHPRNPITID